MTYKSSCNWPRLLGIFSKALLLLASTQALAADPAGQQDMALSKALERDKVCTACHNESWRTPVLSIYQTRMGNMPVAGASLCQSCHGASEGHLKQGPGTKPDVVFGAKSKRRSSVEEQNTACLTCHQKDTRRLHWQDSKHQSRDVGCTNCHEVHTPNQRVLNKATQPEVCFNCHKTIRAQTHRISTHPIAAGKVTCSDCHNPHGSTGPTLLVKNTVNETCYQCHAEKRGPFLWEHPPVVDNCLNCHTPHGSTTQPLLNARGPWLCQQCHGDGAPHPGDVYSGSYLPGGAVSNANKNPNAQSSVINPVTGARVTANNPSARMPFRGCANCHSQIHGSNNPGGNRFIR